MKKKGVAYFTSSLLAALPFQSLCVGTFSRLVPIPSNLCAPELKRVRGYWFLRFLCYWKLSRLPEGPLYTMINILAISLPSFFTFSISSYFKKGEGILVSQS